MGLLNTREQTADERRDRERSQAIEVQLKQARKQRDRELLLLLLGTDHAGKSTLSKQLRLLDSENLSEKEIGEVRGHVGSNIYNNLKALLKEVEKRDLELQASTKEVVKKAEWLNDPKRTLSVAIGEDIKKIWADDAVKRAFAMNEGTIEDSTPYFFEEKNIDRICKDSYTPTKEDLLRVRSETQGISEIKFEINEVEFKMIDIAGQKSQRKKYMHHFENVTAVIFVASMSEYNQLMEEDAQVRKMQESLDYFEEVAKDKWFKDTPIILFLNKNDIFKEKIQQIDLKCMFPDYEGGCDYGKAADYLEEKFKRTSGLNKYNDEEEIKERFLYIHRTCATDTENVNFIFNSVKDMVLRQALAAVDFEE